ncbi:ankyrin repeat domain-containing protein [Oleiagrimonas sp.]|jgi:ankyrin repeat protein|uniref:ankyrin repeat domain-containing protein n=1 Tax=Oleiagrimonas sp. TaxID=2010330 RepID=UPI002639926C|nr:ankyrin repeat domain-containing protein [Oleiagrimonas sp.]MDA3913911.1 ankyrin repeat domain-containing protein [Oleiagrimonas sp.]
MPPTTPRRRPPLMSLMLWFMPALAMIALAAALNQPYALAPLLLANTLMLGAICRVFGFATEGPFKRTTLMRGLVHLILFFAYTVLLFVLIAWPLVELTQSPALGSTLLLSIAVALGAAVLWRHWPVFGLVFLWDEAFLPSAASRSWIGTAISREMHFAVHLSSEERFFRHFLPVSIAVLACSFGTLALSGLHAVVPAQMHVAAVVVYGLVLLPVCSLIMAQRTLRVMRHEGQQQTLSSGEESASGPDHEVEPVYAPGSLDLEPDIGCGSLLAAIREGRVDHAIALLESGMDADVFPDTHDSDQRSGLMLASLLPETRLLRAMIAHGADVNHAQAGLTPLLAATRDSYHGRAEAVMTLLANGADPTVSDAHGHTPLHGAALSAEPTVAAMLVDAEAPVNALDRSGLSPLATACRAANWPLADYLLAHGAKPAPDHGEPALIGAAGIAEDDPRGVRLLLRNKASAHAVNSLGRTALMTAALEGHVDITRALLDAGARINAVDQHQTTALMEAARSGSQAVVQALADAGADPLPRDKHGRDALMLACQSPRTQAGIVRVLMELGARPDAVGEDGRSALDHAASTGRWDLVALLDPDTPLPANLEIGAEPEVGADTPDHLANALRFGHWAIVSTFSACVRRWPAHALAEIYLQLADDDASTAARHWLFEHGLDPHAHIEDGRSLLDALFDALPESFTAARELIAAGASCAGRGKIARVLAASDDPRAEQLALQMLEAGADPFGAYESGRTPLHRAAAGGHLALVDVLLSRGSNPNVQDDTGHTPLHAALEHSRPLPVVRLLVKAGADPEALAANNETPLGAVMDRNAPELLRWLRWNDRWTRPQRPLQPHDLPAAAACGDNEAVCKLLDLDFAVDSIDNQGASALLRAAGMGHLETARLLIEHDADIALAARSGVTPLAAAANAGRSDMVALLVESNAVVDQLLPGKATALMLAIARGHVGIVEQLLDAGADVQRCDIHGRGALHLAAQLCFSGRDSLHARRLLDLLFKRGANINQVDQDAMTPLLLLLGAHAKPGASCDTTHIGALVPVMLDAGADPRHADRRGVTPLHACAMHMLVAPARILLARGAARDAVDELGRTPAELAHALGYTDVAMELGARRTSVPGVQQTLRQPAAD